MVGGGRRGRYPAAMDLRRVRVWEWLTGLTGLVLLVSLFLPWYGLGGNSADAWNALTVIDVILALVALAAVGVPIVAATQRTPAMLHAYTQLLAPLALVAAILAVLRLVDLPGSVDSREAGVWIGAVTAIALLVCDWRSIGHKHFPAAMRPHLDVAVIPTPTADGERRDLPA